MQLKPTVLSKEQLLQVVKVVGYVAVSAAIAQLIAMITKDPNLFGPLTPVVNIVLVVLEKAFTPAKQ